MTEVYPSHPNLEGNYAPLRMECDIQDLIIEGEVPKDLFGSYYRNGLILSFLLWEGSITGSQEME